MGYYHFKYASLVNSMIEILFSKVGIYVGATLFVVGLFSYSLYSWHYSVISDLIETVEIQKEEIHSKDIVINNQAVDMIQLVEDNKVIGFEEYFKGLADANNTVYSDKPIF